jgi:hypothetical protein
MKALALGMPKEPVAQEIVDGGLPSVELSGRG